MKKSGKKKIKCLIERVSSISILSKKSYFLNKKNTPMLIDKTNAKKTLDFNRKELGQNHENLKIIG